MPVTSFEMTNGRPLCPRCERPCSAFASNLRRLPTISELSNVRVASIRTLMSAFPQKQLSVSAIETSALGQKQTFAPQ